MGAPTSDLQENSKLQMQQSSEEKNLISKPETVIFVSNVLKKKL
jgi:hypothetical protein